MRPTFDNYWNWLKKYAESRQIRKGAWMKAASLSPQRYSEFDSGERKVSPRYFIKLCGGLTLKPENVEKMSGERFTTEQKAELKFEGWVDANRELLLKLMDSPQKLKICKEICHID